MNNEQVRALLATKQLLDFSTLNQEFDKRCRLTLRDMETGELGVLTIEPTMLAEFDGDDRAVLWYEWREVTDRLAPSPEHFYDIDTLGRDDKSNVPFLSSEQAGLF